MRNRKLICEWCYERGKADNVIEWVEQEGKRYVVVNDFEKLRALFVTVDPERDTPEVMKSYLGSFDPRIVGLSGDRPAIDAMIKA